MREFRRLFSLLLVFIISMSSFSAFAYNDIPASDIIDYIFKFDVGEFAGGISQEDSDADPDMKTINFLHSIGLWDDVDKSKNSFVSMTEFAIIMSKVRLGNQNAFENVYSQNPDNNKVTYKYALECIVNALGYGYRYERYGKTNEALLIVCDEIDIISSYPESTDEFITRKDLAHLIKKAIVADLCVADYDGSSVSYTVIPGKNLLNTIHNIYDVSGFVNAVRGLSVYGGSSLRDGYVEINRTRVNTNGLDLSGYLGKQIDAYAVLDDVLQEYKIVYASEKADSKYIEVDFSSISSYNDNELRYFDENGMENSVMLGNISVITENGTKINSLSQMSDPKDSEGKIILTSSNDFGTVDTLLIYKYNYYVADYVDVREGRIGLKFGQTYKGNPYIQIDDKAINSVYVSGIKTTYDSIKPNNSLRIFECEETGYTEIIASPEKVSGSITALYDDVVEVAGKTYRLTKDLLEHIEYCKNNDLIPSYDKVKMPEFGNSYTYFIIDNVIVGIIDKATDDYVFGYLKSAKESRTSIDPDATLRVFTEKGEWQDLAFATKVVIDGKSGFTSTSATAFVKTNADEILGDLIKYKLNTDGKITSLYTAKVTGNEGDSAHDINHVETLSVEIDYTKWTINGSRYLFDPKAKVFVIPDNKDKEASYKLVSPSSFTDGNVYELSLYNPNEFLHVGAVVYNGDLGNAVASSGVPTWLHVESIRKVVVDPEDFLFGYKVIGMQYINLREKGKGVCQEASYYVSEEEYNAAVQDGTAFVVGDLMKIDVVGKDLINWSVDIPGGEIVLPHGVYDYETNTIYTYKFYVGEILKIDYENFLILMDCGPEGGQQVISSRAIGIIDLQSNTTTNASISDFHVGDVIQAATLGPNASFMIKNIGVE